MIGVRQVLKQIRVNPGGVPQIGARVVLIFWKADRHPGHLAHPEGQLAVKGYPHPGQLPLPGAGQGIGQLEGEHLAHQQAGGAVCRVGFRRFIMEDLGQRADQLELNFHQPSHLLPWNEPILP